MQFELSLPPVAVQSLQEQPRIRFDDENSSALKCREGHEISSGRRNQSGRLHVRGPQRLKPLLQASLLRCDLKSHPSRLIYFRIVPLREIEARDPSPFNRMTQTHRSATGEARMHTPSPQPGRVDLHLLSHKTGRRHFHSQRSETGHETIQTLSSQPGRVRLKVVPLRLPHRTRL